MLTNIEIETLSLAKEYFKNKINWEQRRYEIAKDVLCRLDLDPKIMSVEYMVNRSIEIADTLIEKLKDGN